MEPLHASAFAYHGMGCLVLGEAGSGKSSLVAEALTNSATLIADDRVQLAVEDGTLMASPPEQLHAVLELRGLGLIHVPAVFVPHPLHLVITLGQGGERLPKPETVSYLGIALPHLKLPAAPATPMAGLLLYLEAMREGRILPPDWHPAG